MDEKEYLQWIAVRGEVETWDYSTCVRADTLIKKETLKDLKEKISQFHLPEMLTECILVCAYANFGSVETDLMLMELACYPDWMK